MFKPGCKGPWMVMQEYVLLGLILSHNYVVEHKYQTHLVPWDGKNSSSNLPSKSWEVQIKPLKFYAKSPNAASATVLSVSPCITNYETETLPRSSHNQRQQKNPSQKAVVSLVLLLKEWGDHEENACTNAYNFMFNIR